MLVICLLQIIIAVALAVLSVVQLAAAQGHSFTQLSELAGQMVQSN
jgi:hypothetical protein